MLFFMLQITSYGVEIYREPESTAEPKTNRHAKTPNEILNTQVLSYLLFILGNQC